MQSRLELRSISYIFVQVEFLAEDEMINVIPNVRMATLHMICVCAISNCFREIP